MKIILRANRDDATRQYYGIKGDYTEKYKLEMLPWEDVYFTVSFKICLKVYSALD